MQHAFQIFNSCILLKKSIWIPDIPSTFVRDSILVDAFFSFEDLVPNREFWSLGQNSSCRLVV